MPEQPSRETDPIIMMFNALQVILKDQRVSHWLQANDPNAYRQANEAVTTFQQTQVHCHCDCRLFGQPRIMGTVVAVECECGNRENACVECLNQGRVTACLECAKKGKVD